MEVRKISDNCGICARSGFPVPSRKISILHVNQAFKVELQIDFTFCTIRGTKYTVLHRCRYRVLGGAITNDRETSTIILVIESEWLHHHGRPDALSADDEMNARAVNRFLKGQVIQFKPRPVRRHNKTGIVERKNGVVKRIQKKLQSEKTLASDKLILSRAVFMSNCFTGSKILSSFELARGYAPAILGAPKRLITEELLTAYHKQSETRALQRMLRSNDHSSFPRSAIKPGDKVLFFFRTTAQNQADLWKEATVMRPQEHRVEVRTSEKAPISKVAYEDLRLRSDSKLVRELSEGLMEDYIDLTLSSDDTRENENEDSVRCLMVSKDLDRARKDIGHHAENVMRNPVMNEEASLQSNEKSVLKQIESVISSKQVTAKDLQFAPNWILRKAIEKEHTDNWIQAYEEVHESDLPPNANVISSHTVYKVKEDEDHHRNVKPRLVTHGNRDDMKDDIRKDCSNVDIVLVRMLISIAMCLGIVFGVADVKGAYLQTGPIKREIFVRPAPDFRKRQRILWKLTKLPYGIVEAGRQWAKRFESWMLERAGLERVFGVNQIFVKRDQDRKVTLILAKLVDDLLVAGSKQRIEKFMQELQQKFEVEKIGIGSNLSFAGCNITEDEDSNVTLSMFGYMSRLHSIEVQSARRREREDRPTEEETKQYRTLAGTLMYLGSAVLPQAALVTSQMQQELGNLRVKNLGEANCMLQEIMKLEPMIEYMRPVGVQEASLVSLSDAAHSRNENPYGQTGVICGLRTKTIFDDREIFHPLHWTSAKQRRVTYSSFGSEILACSEAEDRGYDMKISLQSVFSNLDLPQHILVDSKALFDTITTLYESREYRPRKTVTMIRDAFESGDLNQVTWVPGTANLADALTKRSVKHATNLNQMLKTGYWNIDTRKGVTQDVQEWQ